MKCSVCGKGGLFRKVNESGICRDCEIAALRSECTNLNKTIDELGARDAVTIQNKIAEYKSALEGIQDDVDGAKDKLQKLEVEIKEKQDEIIVLDDNIMLESFALYIPKFNFLTSEEYKEKITITREKEKVLIRDDKAASGNANWTVNGSVVEGRKMIRDLKKLLLRSFNNECDYCIDNVKFSNIEASEKRLEKSFETINKLGRVNSVEIVPEYKRLKYQELYLAYEYQKKKEEEKEEQKRARAELREQQKLEKEIREARERIAKERKHFSAAMKDLENKLSVTKSETERAAITAELEKIQARMLN
jgi:predicted  nucleic acid-binding Zn-ribbon protein